MAKLDILVWRIEIELWELDVDGWMWIDGWMRIVTDEKEIDQPKQNTLKDQADQKIKRG